MFSAGEGSKFPGLNQEVGVVERLPNQPPCNLWEGEASDLMSQVSDLETARVDVQASSNDYYCEYSFQNQSLGIYRQPNSYFKLSGFHFPDAQFIFFQQESPNRTSTGEMEIIRYFVVVEKESGILGDHAGESILQTINDHLTQKYNSDIRKLDYKVVAEENGFHKVFLVEVAGFRLPPEIQTLKKPPLDFQHCPEWTWRSTGPQNAVKIPGWETRRLPNGNLEAIPTPETMQAIGNSINKHEILAMEFENALSQSGYLQNRDPVRQLVDVRLRDGGVIGLECPVVEALIDEIPNPDRSCLVRRTEQSLEESGAKAIPGGYLLEETPGKKYRVIGATKDFSMEGLRIYFYQNFAKPGFSLDVSAREFLKDAECRDVEINLNYQKNQDDKGKTPKVEIDALVKLLPNDRQKEKLKKLQTLGGVHVTFTHGGGGVAEKLIEMLHEPKPVPSKKVVLVVDQSGSMGINIDQVRQNLDGVMKELDESSQGDVQIGLVSYTDDEIRPRMRLRDKDPKKQMEELSRHLDDVLKNLHGADEFRFDAIGKATDLFKAIGPPKPGEAREVIVITDEGAEDGSKADLKKDGLTQRDVERRLAQVGATLKTLYIYNVNVPSGNAQKISSFQDIIYKNISIKENILNSENLINNDIKQRLKKISPIK